MEGGRVNEINLTAGLDTASSDMLVPVNAPTFQHNWQKYQGKFLPNSLRYEHNGWVAGWNVYEFKYGENKIEVDTGIYASRVKLNSNPSYRIEFTNDTGDVLRSVIYTDVSKIINVSEGEASLYGNVIGSSFNGADYTITWDEAQTQAQFNGPVDYTLRTVFNNDYTISFEVIDTLNTFTYKFDLYMPDVLSGDNIVGTLPWGGLEGGIQDWGDEYITYDTTNNVIRAFGSADDITPVITDDNLLTFDFSQDLDEKLNLILDLKQFIVKFDNLRLLSTQSTTGNVSGLITAEATKLSTLDRIKVEFSRPDLVAEDEGVVFTQKFPVYLTCAVKFNEQEPNLSSYIKKPENTWPNSCQFKVQSQGQTLKIKSVFDMAHEYTDTYNFVGDNWTGINLHGNRYNYILPSNSLTPAPGWQPFKYEANRTWHPYASSAFIAFSDAVQRKAAQDVLGEVYTLRYNTYNAANLFTSNAIWNRSDINSAFYQNNIAGYRSIRRVTDPVAMDTVDDITYALNNIPNNLTGYLYTQRIATPTAYSTTQADKTYNQLYNIGKYIGGTYEQVAVSLTCDETFWPFEWVPCFNYNGQKCYWTDGTSVITDLDEFKEFVLGAFDPDILELPIIERTDYNRNRVVTQYKPHFDFDYFKYGSEVSITVPAEMSDWHTRWMRWYPDYQDPQDWEVTYIKDTTYYDFANVTIVEDTLLPIRNVHPGAFFHSDQLVDTYGDDDDWLIFTPNVYDMYPFSVMPDTEDIGADVSQMSYKVWQNHVDVTDKYELVPNNEPVGDPRPLLNGRTAPEAYIYCKGTLLTEQHVFGLWGSKLINNAPPVTNEDYATRQYIGLFHPLVDSFDYVGDDDCIQVSYQTRGIAYCAFREKINETAWVHYYGPSYFNGESVSTKFNVPAMSIELGAPDVTTGYDVVQVIAFEGRIASLITYPAVSTSEELEENTDDKFTFVKAPDELLDNTKLYIDRDTINQYSYNWFYQKLNTIKPLSSGDMFAYFESNVLSYDDAVIFAHKTDIDPTTQKTILYESYFPGILYGDPVDQQGNMTAASSSLNAHIAMNEVKWKLPKAVSATYQIQNIFCKHDLFNDAVSNFSMASVEVLGNDYDLGTTDLLLKVADYEIPLKFVSSDNKIVFEPVTITLNDVNILLSEILGEDAAEDIAFVVHLDYFNNKLRYLKETDYPLISANILGDTIISVDGSSIPYNYISQRSTGNIQSDVTILSNIHQHVKLVSETKQVITCALPYAIGGIKDGNNISVDLGNTYVFDFTRFDSLDDTVLVESNDVRDTEHVKLIGKLKAQSEFQLLKQQWNSTVEVENFWWVDDKHILELNNRFLTLKHSTGLLDDWNGNVWEKIWDRHRSDYIDQFTRVHFVTNVSGTDKALLCCLKELDTHTVECKIYYILPDLSLRNTIYFTLNSRDIGTQLNNKTPSADTAYFNTYNKLTANQLLVQAHWSNTIIDDRLIIGCHLSKNYDQWSTVFNLDTNMFERVVQGYGFVGLKGDLTGGQIPKYCFNDRIGFSGTVESVNKLLDSDGNGEIDTSDVDSKYHIDPKNINRVKEIIVGNAEQQWYIRKQVSGIVSHLTYQSDGQFKIEELPITNKYDSIYGSPSFVNVLCGDLMVQPQAVKNLFQMPGDLDKIWTALMVVIGYPCLWFFSPRLSRCVYLQQTLGQYAYVHYNTLETRPEALLGNDIDEQERQINDDPKKSNFEKLVKGKTTNPLHDISMSFDKQVISQKGNVELKTTQFALAIHLLMYGLAAADTAFNTFVNPELNETLAGAESPMLSQFAMDNISFIAEKALATRGIDMACKNAVVGVKTLDMFYSTSDQQEIYAGPGFVEHQFVADCVAQSTIATDAEGQVQQATWFLGPLSCFLIRKQAEISKQVTEIMLAAAVNLQGSMVCGSTFGPAMATALTYAAEAQKKFYAEVMSAIDVFEKMVEPLGDHISTGAPNNMFRHDLSVEATHKYGSKNEHFMWPCWGVPSEGLDYTDETVTAALKRTKFQINLPAAKFYIADTVFKLTSIKVQQNKIGSYQNGQDHLLLKGDGEANYLQATCVGSSTMRKLPADMAKIEGVSCFLPTTSFKNKNVGMAGPTFAPSIIQDYIVDKDWNISMCCSFGERPWIACKDTKLINCEASNMIVSDSFCGIASPYTAIEVKRGLSKEYMRPWAITPNTLAFNCTGYNTILDDKLYHSFDGYSFRVVDLVGAPGMDKQLRARLYAFQENDRFKRSNIPPANTLLGNFKGEGVQFIQSIDPFWTEMNVAFAKRGLVTGTESEDRDGVRWAIPIFTEQVSTLPAVVKTLAAFPLAVVDGATGLCTTHLIDSQAKYKAPLSVDFSINKNTYRATEEYICSIEQTELMSTVKDLIPSLGLKFIGATPFEAFFYSKATRCYYSFNGSAIAKIDMLERFRDIQRGYWDFVNQEVVMPCLMTYKRLNKEVEDKDTETDNIIMPLLSGSQVRGELPPPLTTIFNDRSWYKCLSLPSGFAYQGPNRVIINRSVFVEYMLQSVKDNMNKWQKLPREKYSFKRKYPEVYDNIVKDVNGVKGWTYNPFVLVTSALGTSESTDNLYEWNITFCWPIEMDLLYGTDNYAVVNIMAETMTPGGKVLTRPTHVFLTKELFTRTGNYGYYNFRYQSKNGAGNRERLYIWSDQYIAISSLNVDVKPVTQRRTEQLTQQIDIQRLKEL